MKINYTVLHMAARETFRTAYIRPSSRYTETAQRAALAGLKPKREIVEGGPLKLTFENLEKMTRKGDEVIVQHVHLLGPDVEAVAARMVAINKKGACVVEQSTGRRSDVANDAILMMAGARKQFAGDKKVHSTAEAKRKGKLGADARGKWLDQFSPSMQKQLRAIWRSRDYESNEDALKAMDEHCGVVGWSKMLAWRAFQASGRMGGRRRKVK